VPTPTRAGVLAVLSTAVVAAAMPALIERHQATTGDGGVYVTAASDPSTFVQAPQSYRVLVPALVWLLPGPEEWGFVALTLLGLGGATGLLYVLLARYCAPSEAVVGALLFVASGACASAAENPYLVDPAAFVFLLGALLLLLDERWWWAAAVAATGVLAKESVLFVLLPAAVLLLARRSRLDASRIALFAAPVAVYLLAHKTSLLFQERIEPDLLGTIRSAWETNDEPGHLRTLAKALAYSFAGAWAALALLPRVGRRELVVVSLLVPVGLSLVAASDWTRLLGWAFPAVGLLIARAPLPRVAAVSLLATVAAAAWVLGPTRDFAGKEAVALAVATAGALAILVTVGRRGRGLVDNAR
jgi:hypothetical protein